eukprot:COSAG05_NODE_344_length_11005_cov_35.313772_9_plen_59_part_00
MAFRTVRFLVAAPLPPPPWVPPRPVQFASYFSTSAVDHPTTWNASEREIFSYDLRSTF